MRTTKNYLIFLSGTCISHVIKELFAKLLVKCSSESKKKKRCGSYITSFKFSVCWTIFIFFSFLVKMYYRIMFSFLFFIQVFTYFIYSLNSELLVNGIASVTTCNYITILLFTALRLMFNLL
ncbi:hypothetical protein EGW08_012863 [Elysia chlorotica]|uniref:Uncharacterized protein n=1 Tax=Elysia chlorotica TaxID=188477 RepID=A0A433TCP3_ELYCH|nr:hypothetical protein EGW08_012863 [Elysia chlorotica]